MIILRSEAQLDSFMERHPFRVVLQGTRRAKVSTVLRPIRRGVSRVVEVLEEEYYSYDIDGDIQDRHVRVVNTETVAIYRPRK